MNIITLFSIQDLLRNNIWPRLLEILIKDFKIEFFKLPCYYKGYTKNKFGPIVNTLSDLIGNKTLRNLRKVCKQFKIIFTNDFYWEKIYKFDLSPFRVIISMSNGERKLNHRRIPIKLLDILAFIVNIPNKIEKNFLNEIILFKFYMMLLKRRTIDINNINKYRRFRLLTEKERRLISVYPDFSPSIKDFLKIK